MIKVLYGFHVTDMPGLAASLSELTGIRLLELHSPMDGLWYSSQDLSAVFRAAREGDHARAQALAAEAASGPQLSLHFNDNGDAYYGGALHPGRGACLLRVYAVEAWVRELEEKLKRGGFHYEEIVRGEEA